jgi:hypothetical protein
MRRLLAIAALALLAGACGGGGGDGAQTPAEALAAVAERMEGEDSAAFSFTATMLSRDLTDKTIPMSGEGSSTFGESETGSLTMDLAEMFEILIAEEAESAEQRQFLQTLFGDPEGWRAEIRFFGDESYMRIPALTDLIGGQPWVKFDEDSQPESGLDVVFGESPSPASFLRYIDAVSAVREVGKERIAGRQTTHYSATVELEQVAEQSPELRERIERAIEETGQRTVPIDVWVDAEGLLRRIDFEDVSPPGEDEKFPTTFRMTMDISEYGVAVEVERPPSGQVMSEAEFDRLTDS